jgi:hypothetical protein
MHINKRAVAAAVIATLGTTVSAINSASAAGVVADGMYNLVINTTPVVTDSYGYTSYKFGAKTGAWNSSFTFGGVLPNAASQAMTDNSATVASNAGPKGSGIGGDTWAGILGITVSGGTFTVNGTTMGGTVDVGTGALTLDVTGRMGAVSSFPALYDEAWNVDNCTLTSTGCINNGNTAYQQFSTGTATTVGSGGPATITGTNAAAAGDLNGDAITDYRAIMVSGGQVGSAWGGFFGAGYIEVWNIQLRSTDALGLHSGFNVDTIFGTAGGDFAQYTASAVIPVPAAVWLFGSGLLGLVGIARRKKKA